MDARGGRRKGRRAGRRVLLAALMASATAARATLVTVILPLDPVSPVPFVLPTVAGGACGKDAVAALESATVEARAQYWAYLMKGPEFAASPADIPGADIADPDIKAYFYSRLRFWLRQEAAPRPSAETLQRLNDVSEEIRLMAGPCGGPPPIARKRAGSAGTGSKG